MKEIWFHDVFETQRQETLSLLLTGKYGYVDPNPGPVVAYPPNLGLFPMGMPEMLAPGTQLAIPWTRARLEKMIRLAGDEMWARRDSAANTVKTLSKNFEAMNRMEQTVDVIAEVALMLFGIGKMAFGGVRKALTAKTAEEAAKIAKAMKEGGMFVGLPGVATTVGLDPTVYVGKGQRWQNVARHVLSLASPSYWFMAVASAWTGDWDYWKYGSEAVKDRDIAEAMKRYARDMSATALRMAAMERQHKMKFYDYRVQHSEAVHTVPGWLQAAS